MIGSFFPGSQWGSQSWLQAGSPAGLDALKARLQAGLPAPQRNRHSNSSGGPLITCRTSIHMFMGDPPGPGAADARAAIA